MKTFIALTLLLASCAATDDQATSPAICRLEGTCVGGGAADGAEDEGTLYKIASQKMEVLWAGADQGAKPKTVTLQFMGANWGVDNKIALFTSQEWFNKEYCKYEAPEETVIDTRNGPFVTHVYKVPAGDCKVAVINNDKVVGVPDSWSETAVLVQLGY